MAAFGRWLRRDSALHRDLFLLACLAALIPAFVTNTLPTSALFPGVESFRWAAFDLGVTRALFVAVLLAATVLGLMLRQRRLMLALLPLLALALTPLPRIGAAPGLEAWQQRAAEVDWTLAAERAAIAEIDTPTDRVDVWLAGWSPALPDAGWLELKRVEVEAARATTAHQRLPYEQAMARLASQIAQLRELAGANADNPALLRRLQPLELQLQAFDAALARIASGAPRSATVALADLRASIGVHQGWVADQRARWLEAAYQGSSAALLLAFLWWRGLGNRVMAAFGILALATALSAAPAVATGSATGTLLAAVQPVFVGLVSMGVWRLLFRALQDNRGVWRSFAPPQRRHALGWALLLWSPFAAVVAGQAWLSEQLYRGVSARLYCQHADPSQCVPPDRALLRDSDPRRDTLREDLHLAIVRQFAVFEERALAQAAAAPRAAQDASAKLRSELLAGFDATLRPRLFDYEGMPQRQPCGLFQFIGCLRNIPLDLADTAYRGPRERLRAGYAQRIAEATGGVQRLTAATATGLDAALRDQSATAARETRRQADAALIGLAAFSVAGNALLLLVAVRALLLILARLLFAQNKAAYTTITHLEAHIADDAPAAVPIVPPADKLPLTLRSGRLLMKTGIDVDGDPPNSLWLPPQPWRWPLRRLRHGAYWLKEIDASEGERVIALNSTLGKHYFAVELPEGAELAFRWDRYAGMSDTITLRKTLSLRLGALVLGRITVASARGPGLLVLHAYTRVDSARLSVSHVRLVAWQFGSRLRVESGRSKKNVYVDHVQVLRADDGLVLHEAAPDGRSGQGLWRELVGLFRL